MLYIGIFHLPSLQLHPNEGICLWYNWDKFIVPQFCHTNQCHTTQQGVSAGTSEVRNSRKEDVLSERVDG